MEDRFKFRAWDTIRKEMVGESDIIGDNCAFMPVITFSGEFWAFDLDTSCNGGDPEGIYKVMQCTGLKDKNGKLIYEGDLVRILYTDWVSKSQDDPRTLEQYKKDKSSIGKVCFLESSWQLVFWNNKYKEWNPSSIYEGPHGEKEIVGNIHENPEILTNNFPQEG